MEVFLMYLWLKLDSLGSFLTWSAYLLGAITLVIAFATTINMDFEDGKRNYKQWAEQTKGIKSMPHFIWYRVKKLIALTIVLALTSVSLPSSNQTAVLVATYYGVQVVKSEVVQKVLDLAQKKANEYLDEQLSKIEGKKK